MPKPNSGHHGALGCVRGGGAATGGGARDAGAPDGGDPAGGGCELAAAARRDTVGAGPPFLPLGAIEATSSDRDTATRQPLGYLRLQPPR